MKRSGEFDQQEAKHPKFEQRVDSRQATVIGNYFKIKKDEKAVASILQYDVKCNTKDMEPGVMSRYVHKRLGEDLPHCYDGGAMLWILSSEPLEKIDDIEVDSNTTISLVPVRDGKVNHVQVFNVLMKSAMNALTRREKDQKPTFMKFMNAYYDLKSGVDMRNFGGEAFAGYKGTQSGDYFCISATTRFFPTQRMSMDAKDSKRKTNFIIRTLHTNKIVFIDKVAIDASPGNTFIPVGGKNISLVEYYLKVYGKNINPNQPLLVRKNQRGNIEYYIPELSSEWNDSHTDMKFKLEMRKITNVPARRKFDDIRRFSKTLTTNPRVQDQVSRWGYELATDFSQFTADVFPVPVIEFSNRSFAKPQWDIREEKMYQTPKIDGKVIVFIEPPVGRDWESRDTDDFLDQWERNATSLGIPFKEFKIKIKGAKGRYPEDYVSILEAADKEYGLDACFYVVILPRKDKEVYGKVKKFLVERGISSQCVVGETLKGKGVLSKITKINVQLCAKLQGVPWRLKEGQFLETVMFVGIDSAKGYIGFVATIGEYRHYSRTGNEKSLVEFMSLALEQFKSVMKVFPQFVVVYRAGEKLIANVNSEVKKIAEVVAKVTDGKTLPISFWLDTKPGARFVTTNYENVTGGTTVHSEGSEHDFYMVSVSSRQGTSVPVLFRAKTEWSKDLPNFTLVKGWTFALTHMYSNWWGAVKVPSVVLYATKMITMYQGGAVQIHENCDLALSGNIHYI